MSYSRFHWRMFNVLARIVGIAFLLGGFIGLISSVRVDSPDTGDSFIGFLVSIFVAVVGVLLLRAKPYRPDLDGYASAFQEAKAEGRKWLTGEPK